MTEAVAKLLEEAEKLSADERADLMDYFAENFWNRIPEDVEADQLAEVRRRVEQIESGEVAVIPGDEVRAEGEKLIASARAAE